MDRPHSVLMQFLQLRAIVEIQRAGSFRKAAVRLGRSQPSLTRAILQFEEEIGLPIFDRSTTGVTLTAHGKRIHARAQSVLAEVERLEDETRQLRDLQHGTVRLALSPVGGAVLFPKAMKHFRRSWPGINVEVFDALYPEAINMLRNGEIDFAVGPTPEDFVDPAIAIETLTRMRIVLATHRSNPRRAATHLEELADCPWFIHGPDFGPGGMLAFQDSPASQISITRCRSLITLLAAVVENNGFTFISDLLFDQLEKRYELIAVPISDPLTSLSLTLATRRNLSPTPAAEALLTHLTRRARSLRPMD